MLMPANNPALASEAQLIAALYVLMVGPENISKVEIEEFAEILMKTHIIAATSPVPASVVAGLEIVVEDKLLLPHRQAGHNAAEMILREKRRLFKLFAKIMGQANEEGGE